MRPPLAAWLAAMAAASAGGGTAAWAAAIGLSSGHLATGAVATPAFYPSALATANGGKTTGLAESGDSLTVTFSSAPSPGSLCPGGWGTKTPNLSAAVTINDNAGATGDDTLTVGAVGAGKCGAGFNFGTVDLGSPGYVTSGSVTFPTSTIKLPSPTTLVIVLSAPQAKGPTPSTVTSGSAAVYFPSVAITNGAVSIGSNTASTTSSIQF